MNDDLNIFGVDLSTILLAMAGPAMGVRDFLTTHSFVEQLLQSQLDGFRNHRDCCGECIYRVSIARLDRGTRIDIEKYMTIQDKYGSDPSDEEIRSAFEHE